MKTVPRESKEKVPWWCVGKDMYLRKMCQQEVREIKMHVVCFSISKTFAYV